LDSKWRVIRGGHVLSPEAEAAERLDILIQGDTIRELGPPGLPAPSGTVEISAARRLLLPGLVNAHTHSPQNLARSIGERFTLEIALIHNPAWRGRMNHEDRYVAALLGAVEMVRKGTTACYDLCFEFPVPTLAGMCAVAQAYVDAGMRAVVAPMLADRTVYEAVPGLLDVLPADVRAGHEAARKQTGGEDPSLPALREALEAWPFNRDVARLAVAPTIPAHCTDNYLRAAARLARAYDTGLHTHLAESKVQALAGVAHYGKTLTAHLDGLGVLGPNFTAAHAVWLDRDDMHRLADRGASVAHCPGSNMRYGSGLAAVRGMSDAGVNVGLGTDSRACSDNLNMFEVMRLASFVSRVQGPDYTRWLTTGEVLTMATSGGARAMGFDGAIGAIRPGCKADIVFLDARNVNYVPLNNPVIQVVNAEDGTAVDSVMIGGRMVLDRGRLTTVDYDALVARVERIMERLRAANAQALALARRLEAVVGPYCACFATKPYYVERFVPATG
jgi:5-methylthioadenosine/S-adenosylhomocysteine deaminase